MSYQPYPPEPDMQRYQQPPNEAPTERQVYGTNAQNPYDNYADPGGNQLKRRDEIYVDNNLRRANIRARITNITYFVLGVLEVILLLRLLLRLLGANEASDFVMFIYNLSHIFVAPFNGIFNDQALGRSVFELSTLIAMLIYALLAWGIVSLGRIIFSPASPGSQL
jgi:hypothetical protein